MTMPPDEAFRRGVLQAAAQTALDNMSADKVAEPYAGLRTALGKFVDECGDPAVPLFVLEESAVEFRLEVAPPPDVTVTDDTITINRSGTYAWGAMPAADDDLDFGLAEAVAAQPLALPAELVEVERLPMPVALLSNTTTIRDLDTGLPVQIADASNDQLGAWLALEKRLRAELKKVKEQVDRELIARMDEDKLHTVTVDRGEARPIRLSAPSPDAGKHVDDAEGLYKALEPFVGKRGKDGLTRRALLSAVEPVSSYKVNMNGVHAILKAGGAPATAAEPFVLAPSGSRSVTVK